MQYHTGSMDVSTGAGGCSSTADASLECTSSLRPAPRCSRITDTSREAGCPGARIQSFAGAACAQFKVVANVRFRVPLAGKCRIRRCLQVSELCLVIFAHVHRAVEAVEFDHVSRIE